MKFNKLYKEIKPDLKSQNFLIRSGIFQIYRLGCSEMSSLDCLQKIAYKTLNIFIVSYGYSDFIIII